MLSRLRFTIFCVLLCSHGISIRPACPMLAPQLKDGMNTVDSENHAQYQRSVPQTTDQQIDDILIISEQEAQTTTTVEPRSRDNHTWPNNIVHYTFKQTLSEKYRATFKAAMNKWEDNSCIQFHLATARGQDHIEFIQSEHHGCSSYVGRKGGLQIVSMNDDCFSSGNALHLVGHAIGLWHEHTRPDRDRYVEVLYENINETEWANFGKISQEQFNLVPDIGYDLESIMHYGPYNFTKNGRETLRMQDDAPLNYRHCINLLSMGQRDQLSYLDKLRVNKLYSCLDHVASLEINGRNCIPASSTTPPLSSTTTSNLPSTTPTELPPSAVKCPFSSSLPQLSPVPSFPFVTYRLKSGNVITLQLQYTTQGMRCAPKCRPKECQPFTPDSLCHSINFQFEIVAVETQNSQKIKSGDKVALRSRCNPSKWLDCSSGVLSNECSITRCSRCAGSLCYDANFLTQCKSHYFKVFGVGRPDGKLLNSHYPLYFRPAEYSNSSALSCYDDDVCKLSSGRNFTNHGEMLEESQRFIFTILTET